MRDFVELSDLRRLWLSKCAGWQLSLFLGHWTQPQERSLALKLDSLNVCGALELHAKRSGVTSVL